MHNEARNNPPSSWWWERRFSKMIYLNDCQGHFNYCHLIYRSNLWAVFSKKIFFILTVTCVLCWWHFLWLSEKSTMICWLKIESKKTNHKYLQTGAQRPRCRLWDKIEHRHFCKWFFPVWIPQTTVKMLAYINIIMFIVHGMNGGTIGICHHIINFMPNFAIWALKSHICLQNTFMKVGYKSSL